jgi:hypothetical protein
MFRLIETVGKTAFFERTNAPAFSPVEDGWWLQKYNTRRFPIPYNNVMASGPEFSVSLSTGEKQNDPATYRKRLLPMIDRWMQDKVRVAIFGVGGHTDFLWSAVPELWRLNIVAYIETNPAVQGTTYRNVTVQSPQWTAGQVDLVLCSSFENELTQLAVFDEIPVKVVLSHGVQGAALPADTAVSQAA